MRALFGAGLHPMAEQRQRQLQGPDLTEQDYQLVTRLGAPFKIYQPDVSPFRVEVAKRIAALNQAAGLPGDWAVPAADRARIRTEVARESFSQAAFCSTPTGSQAPRRPAAEEPSSLVIASSEPPACRSASRTAPSRSPSAVNTSTASLEPAFPIGTLFAQHDLGIQRRPACCLPHRLLTHHLISPRHGSITGLSHRRRVGWSPPIPPTRFAYPRPISRSAVRHTPQILVLPVIDANPAYRDWLLNATDSGD